jgi:ABC-type multidrug transport system fused ATPase/permease subunit
MAKALDLQQDSALPKAGGPAARTPSTLFALIWHVSARHQFWLAVLSVLVLGAALVPLELQRRIVNEAFVGGSVDTIFALALLYAAVAVAAGALKLALNVYRSYVSENAVRWLRATLLDDLCCLPLERRGPNAEGTEVSLVLQEADPIGSFVGVSLSEPLLQGGVLIGIFGYMVYLQPLMALIALAVFSPQFVFVPLMQQAINRRVVSRIGMLRQISGGIISQPDGGAAARTPQEVRIQEVFGLNMSVFRLKFSMNFLMNLMHHLGIAAILAVGGYHVVKGQLEVGSVVAFVSGLAQINDPWGDLVNWFRDLKVTNAKYALISDAVRRLRA